MEVRSRRAMRETSPDRVKASMQAKAKATMRKVQVVYYLTRNGHLEHPHYMEVSHFRHHPLRLKDVMERLVVLRGTGMPSLYSWSCKRSYKSGYVWNDLAENDIIYPSDGAEYVLKGSELVQGRSGRFQIQQLNLSNGAQTPEPTCPNLQSKQKTFTLCQNRAHRGTETTSFEERGFDQEEEEDEDDDEEEIEEYEDEEKASYTTSTTSHSHCSRGVSTDEHEENPPEKTHHNSPPTPPPPPISSILSQKPNESNNTSKRFEDGDPIRGGSKRFEDGDPIGSGSATASRNSVLLKLVSCGNLAVAKAKNGPNLKKPGNVGVKRRNDLHKGVVCKSAAKVVEEDMINCMSENPRFGNLQAEEKEYFSGSIVESMSEDRVASEPVLKKSNSYNEERSCKTSGLGETVEEEKKAEKTVKGNCLPRKKSASSKQTRK